MTVGCSVVMAGGAGALVVGGAGASVVTSPWLLSVVSWENAKPAQRAKHAWQNKQSANCLDVNRNAFVLF